MKADSLAVLALMLGFLFMVGQGVWVRLDDDTRSALYAHRGRLLAGVGAAAGVALLLIAA